MLSIYVLFAVKKCLYLDSEIAYRAEKERETDFESFFSKESAIKRHKWSL